MVLKPYLQALCLSTTTCLLAACSSEPAAPDGRTTAVAEPARAAEVRLAWGDGAEQVGYRPRVQESGAEGPSAVAIAPNGAALVLDRLNQRVLSIAPNGTIQVAAGVPRDAEQIASGPDGALAAWSPLRATVWLYSTDGEATGELNVPRVLRNIEALSLHASHRVKVATAFQETMDLGSPHAPLALDAVLRSAEEGAAFLPDGRGIAARRTPEGAGEIWIYSHAPREATPEGSFKPTVEHAYPVEGPVASIRIVGAVAGAVCARIERMTSTPAIHVDREVRCVHPSTGAELLRVALPAPGVYTPAREIALGGNPPSLVSIHPTAEGLLVKRWSLGGGAEVGR